MKVAPLVVHMLRQNVHAFLKQEGYDTCKTMPVLPKILLELLDTIDEFRDEEARHVRQE